MRSKLRAYRERGTQPRRLKRIFAFGREKGGEGKDAACHVCFSRGEDHFGNLSIVD
jgi:hypothetical protein